MSTIVFLKLALLIIQCIMLYFVVKKDKFFLVPFQLIICAITLAL